MTSSRIKSGGRRGAFDQFLGDAAIGCDGNRIVLALKNEFEDLRDMLIIFNQ